MRTYCNAMRIASRYGMDDIKVAITRVITHMSSPGIGQAAGRLAFMAEFPAHFSLSLAGDVFLQACPLSSTPSADDLKPLMAYPVLVAAMIKYRERTLRNQLQPPVQLPVVVSSAPRPYWTNDESPPPRTPIPLPSAPASRIEGWLQEELRSLGFSE
jgi:hypothetical protein